VEDEASGRLRLCLWCPTKACWFLIKSLDRCDIFPTFFLSTWGWSSARCCLVSWMCYPCGAARDWFMILNFMFIPQGYPWLDDEKLQVDRRLGKQDTESMLPHKYSHSFPDLIKHHATELMFHLRDARWVVYLIGLKCHYWLESQIFTNCSAFLSAPCRLSLPSLWGELSLVTRPAWCSLLIIFKFKIGILIICMQGGLRYLPSRQWRME